jgi:hypothetical protein
MLQWLIQTGRWPTAVSVSLAAGPHLAESSDVSRPCHQSGGRPQPKSLVQSALNS